MKVKEVIKILKKGGVGVMPTDTIYALVGSALDKKAVERIYGLRKRDLKKPLIVLISSVGDLKKFGVDLSASHASILKKIWAGGPAVSVILPVGGGRFSYIHRGTNSIAFRVPRKKGIREFLKKSGPLVVPSANIAGRPAAKNIVEARKYFGNGADFYLDGGNIKRGPSSIVTFIR